MRAKQIFFYFILVIFTGLCLCWLVYFPYNQETVYRGVPLGASFAGEHKELAGRWPVFVRDKLVQTLLGYLNLDAKTINEVIHSPGTARMIQTFAAKDTVIAYTSCLGADGKPAWIFSTWIGWRGQMMRWGFFSDDAFQKVKLDDGMSIWVMKLSQPADTGRTDMVQSVMPERDDELTLSLGVVEGVLLGCVSTDPAAVRHIVSRVRRGSPLIFPLRDRLLAERGGARDTVLDRGWLMSNMGIEAVYEFSSIDESGVTGRLEWRWGGWNTNTFLRPEAAVELKNILGNVPSAFITASRGQLERLLPLTGMRTNTVNVILPAIDAMAPEEGPCFVSLLGGDYSGRILGLRVPALIAGFKLADGVDAGKAVQIVNKTLDDLNGLIGTTLISGPVSEKESDIMLLDTARPGALYESVGPGEKAAFTVRNGWWIFASNLVVLEKLLAEAGNFSGDTSVPDWLQGIDDRSALMYAWIDPATAGSALKNAIAVFSLALKTQNSGFSSITRKDLDYMKRWIEPICLLNKCSVWFESDGPQTEINFRFQEQ